jgi:hypothetical protein
MNKLSFLIVLGVLIHMVSGPSKGYAVMTVLTETGMRAATAQAGIAITATDRVTLAMEMQSLIYGDEDGTDGTPGYVSFNDVSFLGVIDVPEPVSVSVTTEEDAFSNGRVTGITIDMNGAVIDVDHFEIGSITVGSEPGEGKSFGSISIRDYHAEIRGNVRITAQ